MANIDKTLLQNLRPEIDRALADLAKKYGIQIRTGSATFTADNATFKLEVNRLAEDSEVVTKELSDLKLYLKILGLTEQHLTQVFKLPSGRQVTLAGYRRKARTQPFLIKDIADGKIYLAREDMVYRGLGLPQPARFGADIDITD